MNANPFILPLTSNSLLSPQCILEQPDPVWLAHEDPQRPTRTHKGSFQQHGLHSLPLQIRALGLLLPFFAQPPKVSPLPAKQFLPF